MKKEKKARECANVGHLSSARNARATIDIIAMAVRVNLFG